ncbi:MAG: hypothetical protein ACUVXD_18195 [Thermodesulfobacteriota bacterium]
MVQKSRPHGKTLEPPCDPMEMMEKMMKGDPFPMQTMKAMREQGFSPMEMCRQMTQAVERASEMAAYATPELRDLFEDWLRQVEEEILAFVSEQGKVNALEIAERLKISEQSAVFLLSKLAREGKIHMSVEK